MSQIEVIDNMASEYEELMSNYSRLLWTQYTIGYDFGLNEAYQKMMEYLKDKNRFDTVKAQRAIASSEIDKRKMELMFRKFEPYHQSDIINELQEKIQNKTRELSQILNTFRFKLEGREVTSVEISQILMSEDDRELRMKAYLARNQINKPLVDAGFVELLDMRKELAGKLGYESFVHYELSKNDLSYDLFVPWKDQINNILPQIDAKRAEYGKKYIGADTIQPWDEMYIQGKIAPSLNSNVDMLKFYECIRDYIQKFGYNLDDYNLTYDVYPRKNKSEWGYNFTIAKGRDSRILANVKNRYSEYDVLMHESGHGLHSFLLDPEEKILNMGISGIVSEGIANLFGSLIYDETFFEVFFKDNIEVVRREFKELHEYKKLNSLRAVGNIFFDQQLYLSDIKTLDDIYELYWKVNSDYLGVDKGDYEPAWGFRIHHTTHPIYLHNYFMGDVTCEMIRGVFNEKFGTNNITEKPLEFGRFLHDEVIKPSGLYSYEKHFEKISGQPFSLSFMMD